MASFKVEKFRSTKYYSCYKNIQVVIYNLIFSSLVALICSFLCSSSLISSTKHFVFISLPSIWSHFLDPKCLFIVFNVIVAFLVGESKLLGGHESSSPINDIYSEYVERVRRNRKYSNGITINVHEENNNKVYEDKQIVLVEHKEEQHRDNDHEIKMVDQEGDHDDEEFQEAENHIGDDKNNNNIDDDDEEIKVGEEEEGESEELNRRVEAFIARINKQRWIEARMLICGQA